MYYDTDLDIPIGFGTALAMNPEALDRFSRMSRSDRKAVIDGAHQIRSKYAMHNYVDSLADGGSGDIFM